MLGGWRSQISGILDKVTLPEVKKDLVTKPSKDSKKKVNVTKQFKESTITRI